MHFIYFVVYICIYDIYVYIRYILYVYIEYLYILRHGKCSWGFSVFDSQQSAKIRFFNWFLIKCLIVSCSRVLYCASLFASLPPCLFTSASRLCFGQCAPMPLPISSATSLANIAQVELCFYAIWHFMIICSLWGEEKNKNKIKK